MFKKVNPIIELFYALGTNTLEQPLDLKLKSTISILARTMNNRIFCI